MKTATSRLAKRRTSTYLGLAVWAGLMAGSAAAQPAIPELLDQGWDKPTRDAFYWANQGSRLIPYDIFMHLEQADSRELFRSDAHMHALGYLSQASTYNPSGLPIGFTEDSWPVDPDNTLPEDTRAVGLSCAACHTTELSYEGHRYRIDGGPALADFERFIRELEQALAATLQDGAKFRRLRVALGIGPLERKRVQTLRSRLTREHAALAEANDRNAPHNGVVAGPGRLDALVRIKNRLGGFLSPNQDPIPADSPASYPFLWDAPFHDYVQWPANVPNFDVGSLVRNTGEVMGVFADIEITERPGEAPVVETSANLEELLRIEERLLTLQSPRWPDSLPEVDGALAEEGRQLFGRHCSNCHRDIDRTDPERTVRAQIFGADAAGTDLAQATHNAMDELTTGPLEGLTHGLLGRDTFGATANALDLLGFVVESVVRPFEDDWNARHADAAGMELGPKLSAEHNQGLLGAVTRRIKDRSERIDHKLFVYKTRPLNGIWATAPFLHNGSVRTLHQLLLPPGQREQRFCVGSRELDTVEVGLVDDPQCAQGMSFDTSLYGNSNAGHDYDNASLSEAERWALVEYMKTL